MSEQAEKLLSGALKLSSRERARIAAELIASVDGEPEPDAEACGSPRCALTTRVPASPSKRRGLDR